MSDMKAALAKAKAKWNQAKKMKPEFDNSVADGTYVGRLSKASIGKSESSGRLQAAFALVISGGEFKGETVRWYSGLETENNLMYFQRDIARMGKEVPEDINDLEGVMRSLEKEKPSLRVKLVTNGEFQNVRILKRLNAEEGIGEEETPEEDTPPEDVDPEPESNGAEPEPEPDEEPTLEEGTRVAFKLQGKEVAGTVLSVDKDSETARVRTDAGKTFKVKVEALSPAPKTKVTKK